MKSLKGYFENFDDALAHLNRLRASSPLFARFVSTAEKHPSCLQLDLPALLIIPIQRMPRYAPSLTSYLYTSFSLVLFKEFISLYHFRAIVCCV